MLTPADEFISVACIFGLPLVIFLILVVISMAIVGSAFEALGWSSSNKWYRKPIDYSIMVIIIICCGYLVYWFLDSGITKLLN